MFFLSMEWSNKCTCMKQNQKKFICTIRKLKWNNSFFYFTIVYFSWYIYFLLFCLFFCWYLFVHYTACCNLLMLFFVNLFSFVFVFCCCIASYFICVVYIFVVLRIRSISRVKNCRLLVNNYYCSLCILFFFFFILLIL
jgi:hypothetical protein